MSELNLENLYLDDNNFTTAPEGDYRFKVDSYELEYSTSTKFPENTRVIVVHMSVPLSNGETANVRQQFPVCSKMLFLLRQFCECIGVMPEKGRAKLPELDKLIGCTGVFHLIQAVSNNGNEYNNVDTFYAPSKAPTVCDNDDAITDMPSGGFKAMDGEEAEVNPFV